MHSYPAAHHISNRGVICIFVAIFIKAIGSSAAFVNDKGRRQQLKQPTTTRCDHKQHNSMISAFVTPTNMDNDKSNTSISTNDQQSKDLIPPTPLLRPIHAGFIGCGTIASSIIIGLATPEHTTHLANNGIQLSSISITRRSVSKSTMLQERFPTIVTIHEMAHEVVLNSDIIFLCVLPTQVDEVLTDLTERGLWKCDTHILISLVSTSKVDELIIKSGLRRCSVYKLICLPPIARRSGCALLQPATTTSTTTTTTTTTDNNIDNDISSSKDIVTSILNSLGGYVECHNDSMMEAMMIPTAMMGPVYGMMRNNRDWLINQGVSPRDASYFVGKSFLSIVQDAELDCDNPHRFDDLINEQTPGGLNEQALRNLNILGVFDSYDKAMDATLSRLRGESDGSLLPPK